MAGGAEHFDDTIDAAIDPTEDCVPDLVELMGDENPRPRATGRGDEGSEPGPRTADSGVRMFHPREPANAETPDDFAGMAAASLVSSHADAFFGPEDPEEADAADETKAADAAAVAPEATADAAPDTDAAPTDLAALRVLGGEIDARLAPIARTLRDLRRRLVQCETDRRSIHQLNSAQASCEIDRQMLADTIAGLRDDVQELRAEAATSLEAALHEAVAAADSMHHASSRSGVVRWIESIDFRRHPVMTVVGVGIPLTSGSVLTYLRTGDPFFAILAIALLNLTGYLMLRFDDRSRP